MMLGTRINIGLQQVCFVNGVFKSVFCIVEYITYSTI